MTSSKNEAQNVELTTTEKVAFSLKKRHRKETRFRLAGRLAVGFRFLTSCYPTD